MCPLTPTFPPRAGAQAIASALHTAFTPARSWGGISMRLTYRRPLALCAAAALALAAPAVAAAHGSGHGHGDHHGKGLRAIKRVVVIYEENHSFDNLYGGWEGVNGLRRADAAHTTQVNQAGTPYTCLLQNDVNLTSPPLSADVQRRDDGDAVRQPLHEQPVHDRRASSRRPRQTCPAPGVFAAQRRAERHRPARRLHARPRAPLLPGAVPAQRRQAEPLHDRQRRGRPDAWATTTRARCRSTSTCTARAIRDYAIADAFFQAAFGGSFLNHQWLIAAATPTWPGRRRQRRRRRRPALGASTPTGCRPTTRCTRRRPAPTVKDTALTASCSPGPGRGPTPPGVTCGDYAVNTIQPPYQPYAPGTAAARRLPPQTAPTIGDRLSAKGVDWAWYSGGWSNANGDVGAPGWTNGTGPHVLGPQHRGRRGLPQLPGQAVPVPPPGAQLLRHLRARHGGARRAPARRGGVRGAGRRARRALRAQAGQHHQAHRRRERAPGLRQREQRQRPPGRAAQARSRDSRCAKDTMVIVTYDEFGGQWDHVSPPGQGGTPGVHDNMGPGTRIPALVARAGPARRLRRRPHPVRHDVDHGDDRAALRPAAGDHARRRGQRPVERVQGAGPQPSPRSLRPLDRAARPPYVA